MKIHGKKIETISDAYARYGLSSEPGKMMVQPTGSVYTAEEAAGLSAAYAEAAHILLTDGELCEDKPLEITCGAGDVLVGYRGNVFHAIKSDKAYPLGETVRGGKGKTLLRVTFNNPESVDSWIDRLQKLADSMRGQPAPLLTITITEETTLKEIKAYIGKLFELRNARREMEREAQA